MQQLGGRVRPALQWEDERGWTARLTVDDAVVVYRLAFDERESATEQPISRGARDSVVGRGAGLRCAAVRKVRRPFCPRFRMLPRRRLKMARHASRDWMPHKEARSWIWKTTGREYRPTWLRPGQHPGWLCR